MGSLRRCRDGKQVSLASDHVVGRLSSCSLHLDSSYVSTTHALIRWSGQSWGIRDLGSTNGTFVDGSRIPVGELAKLGKGAEIAFGKLDEVWQLVDDAEPVVAAIPLDGGSSSRFSGGYIGLPSQAQPLATLHPEGTQWVLETEDTRVFVKPGEIFRVFGREWRLECPSGSLGTISTAERLVSIDEATLLFNVSRNEEHVALSLGSHGGVKPLGERNCFYLAYVLAQRLAADRAEGQAEPGWIEVRDLLKMIPEYTSYAHLNVDIFRLREVLFDAGVHDASRVVETRRGERRLGAPLFEMRRAAP